MNFLMQVYFDSLQFHWQSRLNYPAINGACISVDEVDFSIPVTLPFIPIDFLISLPEPVCDKKLG